VIDFGRVQRISQVGAGFLQDVGSWIWLPRSLEVELSVDGKSFTSVASIPADSTDATIKDYLKSIPPQDARYVRLRATNSGKNTWIFVDEILIN
jgi:F5/8 type C domain-containing protein